ncbi:UNKNOWN [Stylonychia lemnae]|uniref:Uncharacterized protein n=1 Tax=Stylonychia lemnae TaxID=5949 RepID=A0A077ZTU7_STYLE|nr:UNKNOWN [Stylonychia lemnae]|eukprot:CDW73302.1 UNKNOWN [Stylonychia lemnae]
MRLTPAMLQSEVAPGCQKILIDLEQFLSLNPDPKNMINKVLLSLWKRSNRRNSSDDSYENQTQGVLKNLHSSKKIVQRVSNE